MAGKERVGGDRCSQIPGIEGEFYSPLTKSCLGSLSGDRVPQILMFS